MSAEEIFGIMWSYGAISLEDSYKTRYNSLHNDAPPSPYRLEIRPEPDGPLDPDFVYEIGRFQADQLVKNQERPQFQGIFGVPNAGNLLMKGFFDQWLQNLYPIALEKTEDETGRRFGLAVPEYEHPPWVHAIWGVDDLVTSAITKLAVADVFKKPVVGFSVLLDRSGGNAGPILAQHGIMLHACADTLAMLDYLVGADLVSGSLADEIVEKDTTFCRYMADHP
ncbi:MAG: hypothetical protein WCP91_00705 [Candidatus Berkelbacteria bacterium]